MYSSAPIRYVKSAHRSYFYVFALKNKNNSMRERSYEYYNEYVEAEAVVTIVEMVKANKSSLDLFCVGALNTEHL